MKFWTDPVELADGVKKKITKYFLVFDVQNIHLKKSHPDILLDFIE